jgi:hypothetical protein
MNESNTELLCEAYCPHDEIDFGACQAQTAYGI